MLQAQKKFWGRRPGLDIGDITHVAVNILFVVALYSMVRYWNLTPLAIVLVILSKWRVLAVQPRFWLPNIKANLVDGIVGVSTVMLLAQAGSTVLAVVWALLFVLWLLVLKPRSSDLAVGMQALWAQLLGLITIFSTSFLLEFSAIGILLAWVAGWSAARHFMSNYEEPHYKALSLVWGFLVAQFAWIGFHWVSYYRLFDVNVSNVAFIVTAIAATLGLLYHGYKSEEGLQKNAIIENAVFGLVLVAIVLLTSSWSAQL